MSQSRNNNTKIFDTVTMSQYRYNFRKHDDELIDFKKPNQDNQKIVEGYYHPKAFDPSLTKAIKTNSLFKSPAPTRIDSFESFKIPEVPNKKGYSKK